MNKNKAYILMLAWMLLAFPCIGQDEDIADYNTGDFNVEKYIETADSGHPEMQVKIAECYLYGNGVEKDEEKAAMWYKKAADGYAALVPQDKNGAVGGYKSLVAVLNRFCGDIIALETSLKQLEDVPATSTSESTNALVGKAADGLIRVLADLASVGTRLVDIQSYLDMDENMALAVDCLSKYVEIKSNELERELHNTAFASRMQEIIDEMGEDKLQEYLSQEYE